MGFPRVLASKCFPFSLGKSIFLKKRFFRLFSSGSPFREALGRPQGVFWDHFGSQNCVFLHDNLRSGKWPFFHRISFFFSIGRPWVRIAIYSVLTTFPFFEIVGKCEKQYIKKHQKNIENRWTNRWKIAPRQEHRKHAIFPPEILMFFCRSGSKRPPQKTHGPPGDFFWDPKIDPAAPRKFVNF